jgi:hypothetical protein
VAEPTEAGWYVVERYWNGRQWTETFRDHVPAADDRRLRIGECVFKGAVHQHKLVSGKVTWLCSSHEHFHDTQQEAQSCRTPAIG